MGFNEWWSKRTNQDRTIFTIYLILISIPFLNPLGLPFPIDEAARDAFYELDDIEPGGIIILNSEAGFASYAEIAPGELAVYRHAFQMVREKGCKIITFSRNIEGNKLTEQYIEATDTSGLTYGEDWVELGYISGGEEVLSAVVDDLPKIAPVDRFGNKYQEIPLLQNVEGIADYAYMYYSTASDMPPYARQWGQKAQDRGIPIVMNILSGSIPLAIPYVRAGTMTAYLNSLIGGASYEKLLERPGLGISLLDAQSMAHIWAILLTVIVQGYYIIRREAKELEV
jgi:hypothetical protein